MTLKEYVYKVKGYSQATTLRRLELKTLIYPIYQNTLAALGKGNKLRSWEDYLPTGENKEKGPLTDPDGLIKKATALMNPHLKLKYD